MIYYQYTNIVKFFKKAKEDKPYANHCRFLTEKETNWIVLEGPRHKCSAWIVYAELTLEMREMSFVRFLKQKKPPQLKDWTVRESSRKITKWKMEGVFLKTEGKDKKTKKKNKEVKKDEENQIPRNAQKNIC